MASSKVSSSSTKSRTVQAVTAAPVDVVNAWRQKGQLPLCESSAPTSNTGAQITNQTSYHIDFLEVYAPDSSPSKIALLLGFNIALWDESKCDFYGYSVRHTFQGSMLYSAKLKDNSVTNEIKLIISGKALDYYKDRLEILRNLLVSGAHISRIDLALDDRAGLSTVAKVKTSILKGQLVSHFQSCLTLSGFKIHSKQSTGKTIYLGAASSKRRVRVYDKALEQGLDSSIKWVRYELQARKQYAQIMAQLLVENGGDIPELMRGLIDFREVSQDNTARRPVLGWWATLLSGALPLRSGLKKSEDTIQKKAAWLGRQCQKSLALALGVLGPHFIAETINDGMAKISNAQWDFYHAQYRPTSCEELSAAGLVPF